MAPQVRRSVSFELLSRDDAGDDDYHCALPPRNELVAEKNSGRRRRRSKSKKGKLEQSLSLSLSPRSSGDLERIIALVAPIGVEVPAVPLANGILHLSKEALGLEENDRFHEEASVEREAPVLQENGLREIGEAPRPQENGMHSHEFGENPVAPGKQLVLRDEVEACSSEETRAVLAVGCDPSKDDKLLDQQIVTRDDVSAVKASPIQHFLDEVSWGTPLERTIESGSPEDREGVYNVLLYVPMRCEMLLFFGFWVCLDSFLSLLVVTPLRLASSIWSCLRKRRALQVNDWSDLSCLLILLLVVKFLQLADISYIYHSIRFEPNIKLYVIYNMLEVFDKLFQSFGVDVLQVLFNSAMNYVSDNAAGYKKFLFDQVVAIGCFTVHSFIILFEAITLSAALHHAATNKSLLMLLMSNNFAEIKSSVFKRFSKENMHGLSQTDTVERFHILTCLSFAFAQNLILVEGPWMPLFFYHAAMVMICESFVDLIKHSFLCKFNNVKPDAYGEFLKTLCEQVLNCRRKDMRKALKFVPLGPACVVIKVLLTLYAPYISSDSSWDSWLRFILIAGGTFIILLASKIVVGVLVQRFAVWYLDRHDSHRSFHVKQS